MVARPRQRRRVDDASRPSPSIQQCRLSSSSWSAYSLLQQMRRPWGGPRTILLIVSIAVVTYLYYWPLPPPKRWTIADGQKTAAIAASRVYSESEQKVVQQLLLRRTDVLHQFCDSFDQCFNVEQKYFQYVENKLSVQRMITIRAKSNLVLTMVDMITPDELTSSSLDPLTWAVNRSSLVSTYNTLQALAGFMVGSLSLSDQTTPQSILQIGLGGGATTNFLDLMPLNLSIDVVELESIVYDVAREYFGLTKSSRVKVYIEDGVDFVARAVAKNSTYHSILLDACTNDVREDILCPVGVFRKPQVIENLSKLVGSEGVLSVNMFATRDQMNKESQIEYLFKQSFHHCFTLRFYTMQKMLYCSNRPDFDWYMKQPQYMDAVQDFDFRMKTKMYHMIQFI